MQNGTYTVTPSLAGYAYSPPAPSVDLPANATQNFTASSLGTSYSISGNVSYTGANNNAIFIRVYNFGCSGSCSPVASTSIAAPGPYKIRGLQNGSYTVTAEMDVVGTGNSNQKDPFGTYGSTVSISGSGQSSIDVALQDPSTTTPIAPTDLKIAPESGSVVVQYTPGANPNGQEAADSYTLSWGTTNSATGIGTADFNANGFNQNVYFLNDAAKLVDGTQYYFKLTANTNAGSSHADSSVVGPITIGATTGSNTVSGTVTFPGTAKGPLLVGVYNNTTSSVYYSFVQNPTSGVSYNVAGVPSGAYSSFAEIDMDNSGTFSIGDISNTNGNSTDVSINGDKTINITLVTYNENAFVQTSNYTEDAATFNYSLNLGASDEEKRAVDITLYSGPNVAVPYDMGPQVGNTEYVPLINSNTPPKVGDTYWFQVTFADGSTQDISASVSAVLDANAFPQNLTAVGDGRGGSSPSVPFFSWLAPVSPPADFSSYSVNVDSSGWYYEVPTSTTSALYNADGSASPATLPSGTTKWSVSVNDSNGNSATYGSTYTY